MTYTCLEAVVSDPLFPRADLDLRRGRHIGVDHDAALYDFLTAAKPHLDVFYGRYDCALMLREEGYFYLLPDRMSVPPPLGQRRLGAMDMLIGQALALMRIDPKWLESNQCIPESAILELLQQLLGDERLLRLVQRQRGKDVDQDARKVRAAFSASLTSLERLCFIQREGRGETGIVKPLNAIMRFADPVRATGDVDASLERLIVEGEIAEGSDEPDADTDA